MVWEEMGTAVNQESERKFYAGAVLVVLRCLLILDLKLLEREWHGNNGTMNCCHDGWRSQLWLDVEDHCQLKCWPLPIQVSQNTLYIHIMQCLLNYEKFLSNLCFCMDFICLHLSCLSLLSLPASSPFSISSSSSLCIDIYFWTHDLYAGSIFFSCPKAQQLSQKYYSIGCLRLPGC